MPVLFTLTTTACVSKPQAQKEITLPPKPERVEMPEPTDLKDLAKLLNYYEHLVQDWEAWGDTATRMIENPR